MSPSAPREPRLSWMSLAALAFLPTMPMFAYFALLGQLIDRMTYFGAIAASAIPLLWLVVTGPIVTWFAVANSMKSRSALPLLVPVPSGVLLLPLIWAIAVD